MIIRDTYVKDSLIRTMYFCEDYNGSYAKIYALSDDGLFLRIACSFKEYCHALKTLQGSNSPHDNPKDDNQNE
jgi:hypothetical protein